MRRRILLLALCCACLVGRVAAQATANEPDETAAPSSEFWGNVKAAIEKNLGRPYVWGSSGLKSFDCSGFVWRVAYENGVLLKRTSARKYFMSFDEVSKEDESAFGTLVFFDDLKHIGIVDDAGHFYHAQVSIGTNRSPMNSFWRPKVYGFRKFPIVSAP